MSELSAADLLKKHRAEWRAGRPEREEHARLRKEQLLKEQAEIDALHEQKPILKKISPALAFAMRSEGFGFTVYEPENQILQTCKDFHLRMLGTFDCPIFGQKYGDKLRWDFTPGVGAKMMAHLAGITGIEFVPPPKKPRHHPTHRKAFGYTVTIETYERLKKEAKAGAIT